MCVCVFECVSADDDNPKAKVQWEMPLDKRVSTYMGSQGKSEYDLACACVF